MISINRHWQHITIVSLLLLPVSVLFYVLLSIRRALYRWGLLSTYKAAVPVVVIGNITVGGSGKTPLVIALVEQLKKRGLNPGIVTRGYGGQSENWPQAVSADSDPKRVGDEPILLAQACGCPVYAAPDRPAAIQALLAKHDCDILLSDDGLQHYAMQRSLEIVVVDAERTFGNGFLLPAGPLREPQSRLQQADWVIYNGGTDGQHPYNMQLVEPVLRPLHKGGEPTTWQNLQGKTVQAIAGIGHPQRFFHLLRQQGLCVEEHPFPDHHAYQASDLGFVGDAPLLMTEKDAVKCQTCFTGEAWVVQIKAQPNEAFLQQFHLMIDKVLNGQQIT
jgi:tetraacyldisaccharide 4'-kinase